MRGVLPLFKTFTNKKLTQRRSNYKLIENELLFSKLGSTTRNESLHIVCNKYQQKTTCVTECVITIPRHNTLRGNHSA